MRLRIRHETTYTYRGPANRAIQVLRLTPRGHDGQFVINWRIDIDRDCKLDASVDPFGNMVNSITVEGPLDGLVIVAEGEVETRDANGVVRGQMERMPANVFLRDTMATETDQAIRDLADKVREQSSGDPLGMMHEAMRLVGESMTFEVDATEGGMTASEALSQGRGAGRDFAHVMIAIARHLGVPARYVSGYLFRPDPVESQDAAHAWAETLVPDLGWIAFDPANGLCATDAYVRVAVGLDHLGAAPVRGARYGGDGESLAVHITIDDVGRTN